MINNLLNFSTRWNPRRKLAPSIVETAEAVVNVETVEAVEDDVNVKPIETAKAVDVAETVESSQASQSDRLAKLLDPTTTQELTALYDKLSFELAPLSNKVIQFLGVSGQEGVSTVVRQFAAVASMHLGKEILILQGERYEEMDQNLPMLPHNPKWHDTKERPEAALSRAIYRIGQSSLYLSPYAVDLLPASAPASVSTRIEAFINLVRERYDMTLIDSSPAMGRGKSLKICPKVDGVVLVIEAEKTRIANARAVVEKITELGGNVMGVVYNRQRNYLPAFLQKLLGPLTV
jgi:Mrp family chromosome partitioning ATPase